MRMGCKAFRCQKHPSHNEPVGAHFKRLAVRRVEEESEYTDADEREAFEYDGFRREVKCYADSDTAIRHPKRESVYVHEHGMVQCYSACANYEPCAGCEVCGFEAAMIERFDR